MAFANPRATSASLSWSLGASGASTFGSSAGARASEGADGLRLEPDRLFERVFERLRLVDRTGGGDHFHVTVRSGSFDGLSLVEQHRLVNRALAAPLADGTIHELRITTNGTA